MSENEVPRSPIVPKPILPVDDMTAAMAFFRRLGFDVESFDDGYALVRHRDDEIVHLRAVPDLDPVANEASVYWHVRNADEWHRAFGAADVEPGPIADMPWGMREFTLTDPSGNVIRVGSNV